LPPDDLTLAFDTSAAHCAAALLRGDRVIEARAEPMGKGQAERLMPMLEEMLASAGVTWGDLSLIGVGIGPGNFTGVRISVAAARGLALSLGIPAVGVTALEAAARGQPRPVLVAIDARRGQVYLQLFQAGETSEAALAETGAMPAWAFTATAFTGSGAELVAHQMNGGPTERALLPPAMPLAEAIARIARDRASASQPRPAPLYLRAADAAPPRDPAPELLP
jgi:tRNA threonylcarbamoyl adenosine modification protein YeaZ